MYSPRVMVVDEPAVHPAAKNCAGCILLLGDILIPAPPNCYFALGALVTKKRKFGCSPFVRVCRRVDKAQKPCYGLPMNRTNALSIPVFSTAPEVSSARVFVVFGD